jgi:hypothetical protein
MILFILVGLWSLIRGQITVAPKLKLVGKPARIYGGVVLFTGLVLINPLTDVFDGLLLNFMDAETIQKYFINLFFTLAILVGLVFVVRLIKLEKPNESSPNPPIT